MDQKAGEVVTGRILMEQLPVERVRQPGERMPVSLLGCGESPGDRFPSEAVADMKILRDVAVVVVIDERVAVDRVV